MKRSFDVALSFLALLVVAPALTLVCAFIFLWDRGNPLFLQKRVGKDAKPFRIIKLRTMAPNVLSVEDVGQVGQNHPLVTAPGRLLRRLKIDELPQLVNVLVGDMSLIGPRPTIRSQADALSIVQARRLAVRPGMTGWAQVNGNVALSWEDRILLDVWYVDHWSPLLDLDIVLRTLVVLVAGEHPNHSAVRGAREYAVSLGRSR